MIFNETKIFTGQPLEYFESECRTFIKAGFIVTVSNVQFVHRGNEYNSDIEVIVYGIVQFKKP